MNYVDPGNGDLLERKGCLLVVADGMGGAAGGRLASQTAVKTIAESYYGNSLDPLESLKQAFEVANSQIYNHSQEEAALKGMGTTATAVAFVGKSFISAHVGDTRLYRLRNHNLEHLTVDHSMVAQMVREGLITPEDARRHPQRNILMRSMGIQQALMVDLQTDEIQSCDCYLLCTDGLHGMVEDNEIAAVLDEDGPDQACRKLVDLANERGGYDNITVQVAHVEE